MTESQKPSSIDGKDVKPSFESTGLGQSAGQDSKGPSDEVTKKNPTQKEPPGTRGPAMIEPEDDDSDVDPTPYDEDARDAHDLKNARDAADTP